MTLQTQYTESASEAFRDFLAANSDSDTLVNRLRKLEADAQTKLGGTEKG